MKLLCHWQIDNKSTAARHEAKPIMNDDRNTYLFNIASEQLPEILTAQWLFWAFRASYFQLPRAFQLMNFVHIRVDFRFAPSRYLVTTSLIGRVQGYNQPCIYWYNHLNNDGERAAFIVCVLGNGLTLFNYIDGWRWMVFCQWIDRRFAGQ